MADAELHIIIKEAGDPEKLAALLKAAIAMRGTATKVVVPTGYKCIECYSEDGGHGSNCSLRFANDEASNVSD